MQVQIGSGAKGDCCVGAESSAQREVNITTKSPELLEPGIRAVITRTLDDLDVWDVAIEVEDSGAVDYVLAARVETAVRRVRPQCGARFEPSVPRSSLERDRPRRSRLYAPGNNPRFLTGIEIHQADCVLLDLEDSVPVEEKTAARILVKWLLGSVAFPEEVWVRINPLEHGGREDLAEVLQGRPNGVCLPKSESGEDIDALAEALLQGERALGLPEGSTAIMPIIETARGVLQAAEIAASHPRVVMVAFGAEDYTRDVDAVRTDEALLFARSAIVAGAKAARIQASDTVYADVADVAGLALEAQRARELGFDGKGAVNPRQIPTIHDAFTPNDEALAKAHAMVAAAEEARKNGLGAVALDGKMIDEPVLERAQRMIRYAERLSKGGRRHA